MQNKFYNNRVVTISMAEADAFAMEYFMKICGFNREGEKYQRMLKQGLDIKEQIRERVEIKAVLSSFPGISISGNKADLNGVVFECNAFQRLDPAHICRIYAYVMSSGIYELEDSDPIMDQLFADIWGTAYVDAGLELLKRFVESDVLEFCESKEVKVLDSFGPGFFGMDVTEVGKFFQILDGDLIGVKARSNSLMLPLKSCSGFFLAVDDASSLPGADCKSCLSGFKNCAFCQAVIKQNK